MEIPLNGKSKKASAVAVKMPVVFSDNQYYACPGNAIIASFNIIHTIAVYSSSIINFIIFLRLSSTTPLLYAMLHPSVDKVYAAVKRFSSHVIRCRYDAAANGSKIAKPLVPLAIACEHMLLSSATPLDKRYVLSRTMFSSCSADLEPPDRPYTNPYNF